MTQQKVIRVKENGAVELAEAPIPSIEQDEILVRNVAAAQNPIDWQCVYWDGFVYPDHILGCDYAGVVEDVGAAASSRFKKGDRVAGFVHGAFGANSTTTGAFAEYVAGLADAAIKLPENISFEEGATLGLGLATVAQALYVSLGLPLPGSAADSQPLLIYGGSTSMGALAVQLAPLSGAKVISTCSSKNIEFVKSLGADAVFDRTDTDLVRKIKKSADDKLTLAIDPVSREGSPQVTTQSIGPKGGKVHCTHILNKADYREDVDVPFMIVFTMLGRGFGLAGMDFPAVPEHRELMARFSLIAEKLVAEGKIRPHPTKVMPKGLASVKEGLEMGRDWVLSAEKIVYRISDTP